MKRKSRCVTSRKPWRLSLLNEHDEQSSKTSFSIFRLQLPLTKCLKPTKIFWRSTEKRLHCAGSTTSSWWSSKVHTQNDGDGFSEDALSLTKTCCCFRQHSRFVSREACAEGGSAWGGPVCGRCHRPQQWILSDCVNKRKGSCLWARQGLPTTGHSGRGRRRGGYFFQTAIFIIFFFFKLDLSGDWASCDVKHWWIPCLHICIWTNWFWKNPHYGGTLAHKVIKKSHEILRTGLFICL